MYRYGLTIFLGAVLLFLIQPIAAKLLLPTFGGVAAVWTTAMLFFQVALLAGYVYVHALQRILAPRFVWFVHTIVIGLAALTLPVRLPFELQGWEVTGIAGPVAWSLAIMVGAVFFVVSATGPLVQYWQAKSHPLRSPFRLYALSNLGSLVGLLSYPLVFEPLTGLGWQTRFWSLGFVVYAILCVWSGMQSAFPKHATESTIAFPNGHLTERVSIKRLGLWILLSAIPAAMLMSTTNLLCQEIASFPFLWVLPLSAYLLSFIICFEKPKWYRRRPFTLLLFLFGMASLVLFYLGTFASLVLHMVAFTVVCFSAAMICNGELERSKPSPRNLTLYFVMVSLGGLLGSAIVVLLMPRVLNRYFEFHGALVASVLVACTAIVGSQIRAKRTFGWESGFWTFSGSFVVFVASCSIGIAISSDRTNGMIYRGRSDYGLVGVSDTAEYREMINGQTRHGRQFHDPIRRTTPIDYYDQTSGVGIAFRYLQNRDRGNEGLASRPIRAGVIGLGGGVLATWLRTGDSMRFYEVNPQVVGLANRYFTYLTQTPGKTSVATGDARVLLERELRGDGPAQFDILVVDAFNSDSIPVHLLTRECLQLYWEHLNPDGILAIHISNRYLDLLPILADGGGRSDVKIHLFDRRLANGEFADCIWVLMSADLSLASYEPLRRFQTAIPSDIVPIKWTDDFSSLWRLIDWTIWIDWQHIDAHTKTRGKTIGGK